MNDSNVFQSFCKTLLQETILPITFKKFAVDLNNLHITPVIVGGAALDKCVDDDNIKQLLNHALSEDIDIKLIYKHKHNDDVKKLQRQIVLDILDHLQSNIQTKHFNNNYKFKFDDILLKHHLKKITDANVLTINIFEKNTKTRPLLDISILAEKHNNIPFNTIGNLNYASCEFCYYDNLRMMLDRALYFESNHSMFALLKFYRYVTKFMAMYLVMNKMKFLPDEMKLIYNQIHKKMKALNYMKLSVGLHATKKIYYDASFTKEVKTQLTNIIHATNMESLIKEMKLKVPNGVL